MTAGARVLIRPREAALGALLATLALSVALVVGNPGVSGIPVMVLALTAIAGALILSQVYAGYLVMVVCCFTLVVVAVTPVRYLNAFDMLLPFMFPVALFGALRRQDQDEALALEAGPAHERIREATRRFGRSVVIFYVLAAVSIIPIVFRIGTYQATNSAFLLIRTVEGTLLFPLGLWWLRSERRIHQVFGAAMVGGFLLAAVMLGDRLMIGTTRPGMTWILNQPDHPTEDPNQAGLNMVLLMALAFAQHSVRPRIWTYLLIAAGITVLVLSQSRSGLLSVVAFLALSLRRVRVRYIVGAAILIGLGSLLAPKDFWERMVMTVTMHRGSSELYSWMLRVYGYIANVKLFLDHWLIGVGFFGGQFVSQRYNALALPLGAENYFLETAVGMGVIGLAALAVCFVRLFALGRVILEVAPAGSLGHHLARLHAPLIIGIMVACLTGNTLVGLIANAQLAVWCSLMVRAGHHSLRSATVR